MLYEDPVIAFDGKIQTLKTSSGKILKYGSLIVSTGCEASRYINNGYVNDVLLNVRKTRFLLSVPR